VASGIAGDASLVSVAHYTAARARVSGSYRSSTTGRPRAIVMASMEVTPSTVFLPGGFE